MEFIDHTGHIFSLPDYSQFPVGYEYSENPYVFWLSDDYSSNLSVDCFYLKPIYILTDEQDIVSVTIETNQTNHYKLLDSKTIQKKLEESGMYDNDGKIDWSKATFELEFFTDEAKDLINNHKENVAQEFKDLNTDKEDFTAKLIINKNDIISNVIGETFYFIGVDGKSYDILNESLIYDPEKEGYAKTSDKLDNEFGEAYGSDKIVYIDDENNPVSKEKFRDIISDYLLDYSKEKSLNISNPESNDLLELQNVGTRFKNIHIRYVASRQKNYSMIPFYVLGNVKEAGSWMTNILITLNLGTNKIYCPITVGGTYVDEQEELIINGKNMGIDLPKDICRALYNISFWNEVPDLSLWNQKIKEYLLNYMKLKGERGNFQSAIQALKWFGYGDRISLSALVQTDNQVINQYICDNFDLNFDVINEFRYFRYSTLLSLSIPGIIEDPSGETNLFQWNEDFWGEGKPKLHDRFSEYIEPKHYDEGDIDFVRPYYDWTFNEIGLKLCALKYYYKKYFLPIHLSIHRASITNQCFANDVKMLNTARNLITEKSFFARDDNFYVRFNDSKIVWLEDTTYQNIIVDPDTWIFDNHFDYEAAQDTYYAVNDNCFCVDISFIIKNFIKYSEHLFYCKMFTYQDDNLLMSSDFSFVSNEETYNIKHVIYPKFFNKDFNMNFWLDKKYTIKLLVNGEWFEYNFELRIPELDIELGRLEYKYDYQVVKQFSGFDGNIPKFNVNMYLPDLVTINNLNFANDLFQHLEDNNLTFVDKKLMDSELYYYTLNDKGEKIILSTGYKTLINKGNKYYLVPNTYYIDKIDNDDFSDKIIKSDTPIYSSICKNVDSLIDLYSVHSNIPKNLNLMNKIHIFKLFKKEYLSENINDYEYSQIKYEASKFGKNVTSLENIPIYEYEYGYDSSNDEKRDRKSEFLKINYETASFSDNDSEEVKNLYLRFFDDNGDWNKTLEFFDSENNIWINETRIQKHFDLYLMHDYDGAEHDGYWYVILISKKTIGDSEIDLDNILVDKTRFYRVGYDWSDEYFIQYDRSDEKVLINRMNFSRMNGVYHFRSTDMIAARLNNFKNIASRLKIGSRWTFTPLAYGTTYEKHYSSPSNIGLMSIGEGVIKAPKGYYRVNVKYSVDNFVNETQVRSTKLLIDDSLPLVESVQDDIYIPVKPSEEPTEEITEEPTVEPTIEGKYTPEIIFDLQCRGNVNNNKTYTHFIDYNLDSFTVHDDGVDNINNEYKLIIKLNNPPYAGYKFKMTYDVVDNGRVEFVQQTLSEFTFTLKRNDDRDLYLQRDEYDDAIVYFIHFRVEEDDYFYQSKEYTLKINPGVEK